MILNNVLKVLNVSRPQKKFIQELFTVLFSMQGRFNFANLSRYSNHPERYFRRWFAKSFDFVRFNLLLMKRFLPGFKFIIAVDAVNWRKAGKKTYGLGRFWSSCEGQPIRGLEFFTVSIVPLPWRTCFHLGATQAVDDREESRLEQYLYFLLKVMGKIAGTTSTVVADGWFARKKFIDGLLSWKFHLITKLRKDANMRYLYYGPQKKGPGRRKKYDGKVDPLNTSKMHYEGGQRGFHIYSKVVYHVGFKTNIKLVVITDKQGNYELLMSSNLELPALKIIEYYRLRFQIELLYRDAKQHMGLTHCQATSQQAQQFHANASLSAVTLGRIQLLAENGYRPDTVLSIQNLKRQKANEYVASVIFSILGVPLKKDKLRAIKCKVRQIGALYHPRAA